MSAHPVSQGVPDRLNVPTCIGCGAMSVFGTCETGCSERKLALVRAAAYDALLTAASTARASADAFTDLAHHLSGDQPVSNEVEDAYRSAQRRARELLRHHPEPDQGIIDPAEPVEHATTWFCVECGGLDAPQPCLGICVWRPVEWVKGSLYEELREQAILEQEREQRLRHLLRRVAWVTPRPRQWEHGWRHLHDAARQMLDLSPGPV